MVDAMIITVDEGFAGERIDKVICSFSKELSRSGVQKMMECGAVTIASKPVSKNYKVRLWQFQFFIFKVIEPVQKRTLFCLVLDF